MSNIKKIHTAKEHKLKSILPDQSILSFDNVLLGREVSYSSGGVVNGTTQTFKYNYYFLGLELSSKCNSPVTIKVYLELPTEDEYVKSTWVNLNQTVLPNSKIRAWTSLGKEYKVFRKLVLHTITVQEQNGMVYKSEPNILAHTLFGMISPFKW